MIAYSLVQIDAMLKVTRKLCLTSKLNDKDVLFLARLRFRRLRKGEEISMSVSEWERLISLTEEA